MKGVGEVFVYGDSLESYLVSIIVPNKEVFMELAKANKINGNYEDICKSKDMIKLMLKAMQDKGKEEGLHGFEQIQKLYIEPVSFAVHGCMTSTFKLQRFQAKKVFKSILADLYSPFQ